MTIEIIEGSLFDATTKYIAHQTNCMSKRSAHLAATMFAQFPYADVYTNRKMPDVPGTICIRGNGQDQRFVINMFGQVYPGSPKFPDSTLDGSRARVKYFFKCLKAIHDMEDLESIAFPYKVGCGAAGGDWTKYLNLLEKFATAVGDRAQVLIYKLPE